MTPGGPPPSRCWCWPLPDSRAGSTKRISGSSNWGPGHPTGYWKWSTAFRRSSRRAPPQLREPLAQLQLTALEHLQNGNVRLDDAQRVRIEQVRAESLRAAGRSQDALQVYQQFAADQPDNGQVQIDYAQLLLESDDPDVIRSGGHPVAKMMRRLRPGSDDWFRAKYSFALTLFQRNQQQDRATAGQQLRYLKATSSVDQTPWKTQVDELLQRCPK